MEELLSDAHKIIEEQLFVFFLVKLTQAERQLSKIERILNDVMSDDMTDAENAIWDLIQNHKDSFHYEVGIMELPYWDECDEKMKKGEELNPIEDFILNNEPSGNEDKKWREDLLKAIESFAWNNQTIK